MRSGPDGGVFYELAEDHVAVQSVGGHPHRLLRYLWRVTCPQLVDERPVGRPPVARDPSFAQPEVGDAGTAIGVGWVECFGALRSLAGKGHSEVPPPGSGLSKALALTSGGPAMCLGSYPPLCGCERHGVWPPGR